MKNKLNVLMVLMISLLCLMSVIVLCPSLPAPDGDDNGDDGGGGGGGGGDSGNNGFTPYGWCCDPGEMLAQSFLPPFNIITSINLTLWQRSSSNENALLQISLRHTLTGDAIASAFIKSTDLPENREITQVTVDIPDVLVNPSETYYIVWNPDPAKFSNLFVWRAMDNNPYSGGNAFCYNVTGSCWKSFQNLSVKHPDPDFVFTINGFNDDAPLVPVIQGSLNGDVGKEYAYTIMSTDQNNDTVSYFIDWGDHTNNGWTNFLGSGLKLNVSHIWENKGEYNITVKAKDIYGLESDWATFTVTMPCNTRVNTLFIQFLQNHPNLFPLLQKILQRSGFVKN